MREVNKGGEKNSKRNAGKKERHEKGGKSNNYHGNGSGEEKRKVG